MTSDVRREAEDLIRYYAELVRRLAQNGVRDITELLGMFEQLERAVAAITAQEIGWALEQVHALIERLVRIDSNIQALRRLKTELGSRPEHGAGRAALR